jgi:peptidyl-prolyl cis-trans isomerase A (cyclophilin A)
MRSPYALSTARLVIGGSLGLASMLLWEPVGLAQPAGAATARPGPVPARPAARPPVGPGRPGAAAAQKPGAPAPAIPAEPLTGPFTLAQATVGLPGTAPLVASIEFLENGDPKGVLRCDLFAEQAPLAVANFIGLARGLRPYQDPQTKQWVRRPFYDGNFIHRVVPDALIQAGDPNCTGDYNCHGLPGSGEPGYRLPDELRPELRFDRPGVLAMADRGPGTAGSQFFITAAALAQRRAHRLRCLRVRRADQAALARELGHARRAQDASFYQEGHHRPQGPPYQIGPA